jgi:hypothetical protein
MMTERSYIPSNPASPAIPGATSSSRGTSSGYDPLDHLVTMLNTGTSTCFGTYAGMYPRWPHDSFVNRISETWTASGNRTASLRPFATSATGSPASRNRMHGAGKDARATAGWEAGATTCGAAGNASNEMDGFERFCVIDPARRQCRFPPFPQRTLKGWATQFEVFTGWGNGRLMFKSTLNEMVNEPGNEWGSI